MKLNYIIFYVSDAMATYKFYENAFGIKTKFIHESKQYVEMETGTTVLGFANNDFIKNTFLIDFQENSVKNKPAGLQISLTVDNVRESLEKAVSAGAILVSEPKIMPWDFEVAFVKDTNGILIELCKQI